MDLRCFAFRGFNFRRFLKSSFISFYKRLIVTINLVLAYTRSDVQVNCVSASKQYILRHILHPYTPHLHASRDFYVSHFNIYRIYGWWQRIVYAPCACKNKYIYRKTLDRNSPQFYSCHLIKPIARERALVRSTLL